MYSREELISLWNKIEDDETYFDLSINEKLWVISNMLENVVDLGEQPYMIETEQDKRDMKNLKNALKILKKLRCF